jgi:hypothetical protein
MKLYHVSDNPNLTTMIPRIPQNRLTRLGYENGTIGRICFAPTIGDCIAAAPRGRIGELLYVYTPVNVDQNYVYKPKPSEVPDAKYSHEVWYLKPVSVKLVCVIVVGDPYLKQQFVGPKAYEKHFTLQWHNYKRFKNMPNQEAINEYVNSQPSVIKRKQEEAKSEKVKSIVRKSIAAATGVGLLMLVGGKLVNLRQQMQNGN